MSDRRWWASHYEHRVGPFSTREEAAAEFFKDYPDEDEAMTGYGTYASHFDIQWIKRPDGDIPVAITDDAEKLRCIAALSEGERVAMAKWALKGYRFVFFSTNGSHRQWKALDTNRHRYQEVHAASTLYVLLAALGEPK